jgi:Xaa-Pro aminopeptidase
VPTTPLEEKLRESGKPVRLTALLDLYLRTCGIRELVVPSYFHFAYAEGLRKLGYQLSIREDPFFPARLVKRPDELRAIEECQEHAEAAMAFVAGILAGSEIRGGWLYHESRLLTSEGLRSEIQKFLLERNCQAFNTIVAGGDQGADPHTRGRGPLPANQTIIVDIFPRSERTRYWGDMTRTFVRGKASAEVHRLYNDVLEAQKIAFSLLRAGTDASEVHGRVAGYLKDQGNPNGETRGRKTGFIHGTGHGIGLEIHEMPRIGRIKCPLVAGNVVTVEPGLYYPGIGSVRLEDVVVITENGCRNLNSFPKELEL